MISRRQILAGVLGASVPLRASKNENVLGFATSEHDIQMTVEFYDRYSSQGFSFTERATQNHFCLSEAGERNQNCLKGFVGSLAVVKYRIRARSGAVGPTALRERARTIDQDGDLPERPPVDRTIGLIRGVGSDIQAFGYETESIAPATFPQGGPWSLIRQDLYLEGAKAPFLVVHWKHELTAVRMLDAIPCKGTSFDDRSKSSR